MIEDDVINRIRTLKEYNRWSTYTLARKSELSYSTVNNIFVRRTCPGIPTLKEICNGFEIGLSQFFEFDVNPLRNSSLTEEEERFLNDYRRLSKADKKLAEAYMQGLCKR